jgi:hypothetical protein
MQMAAIRPEMFCTWGIAEAMMNASAQYTNTSAVQETVDKSQDYSRCRRAQIRTRPDEATPSARQRWTAEPSPIINFMVNHLRYERTRNLQTHSTTLM